jgi:hypothetical protein
MSLLKMLIDHVAMLKCQRKTCRFMFIDRNTIKDLKKRILYFENAISILNTGNKK